MCEQREYIWHVRNAHDGENTWNLEAGDRFILSVCCPECRGRTCLATSVVDDNGVVSPEYVCCNSGCGFHRYIKLVGWIDLAEETKRLFNQERQTHAADADTPTNKVVDDITGTITAVQKHYETSVKLLGADHHDADILGYIKDTQRLCLAFGEVHGLAIVVVNTDDLHLKAMAEVSLDRSRRRLAGEIVI